MLNNILTAILLVLVITTLTYLLVWVLKQALQYNKILFFICCLLTGLLITIISFFVLSNPDYMLAEENEFIKTYSSQANIKEARQYVDAYFVPIDVSTSKSLIDDPESSETDSSRLVITDRAVLVKLFNLLVQHADVVDLVVADINFPNATANDVPLSTAMLSLQQKRKLLLPNDPADLSVSDLNLSRQSQGSAVEHGHNNMLISHTLIKDGVYSMSAKIYSNITGNIFHAPGLASGLLREKQPTKSRHVVNRFIPELLFDDEVFTNSISTNSNSGMEEEKKYTEYTAMWPIGKTVAEETQGIFIDVLKRRKKQNRHNVIIIGAFKTSEDSHATIYGNMHGCTIITNVVWELIKGKHYFSFYAFLLAVGFFSSIIYVIFHRRYWIWSDFIERSIQSPHRNVLSSLCIFLIGMIYRNGIYLLVATFIIFMKIKFNWLINGIGLVAYFIMLKTIIKFQMFSDL